MFRRQMRILQTLTTNYFTRRPALGIALLNLVRTFHLLRYGGPESFTDLCDFTQLYVSLGGEH